MSSSGYILPLMTLRLGVIARSKRSQKFCRILGQNAKTLIVWIYRLDLGFLSKCWYSFGVLCSSKTTVFSIAISTSGAHILQTSLHCVNCCVSLTWSKMFNNTSTGKRYAEVAILESYNWDEKNKDTKKKKSREWQIILIHTSGTPALSEQRSSLLENANVTDPTSIPAAFTPKTKISKHRSRFSHNGKWYQLKSRAPTPVNQLLPRRYKTMRRITRMS